MSMCRVFSCVVGRGCLLWPVCYLSKSLLAFAVLHFVLQGQICLLLQLSLDFLLLHSSPHDEKDTFFFCLFVLVLEDLVGLHRTVPIHLWHSGWGVDLYYCNMNGLPWKRTEIILCWFMIKWNSSCKVLGTRASRTRGIGKKCMWLEDKVGNVGIVAEVRGQIMKGLRIIAKNFGFYLEGYVCETTPFPIQVF